jgi:hypothetical protein
MRELQLFPTRSWGAGAVVHKLQFVADGSELVGWVDETSASALQPEPFSATALFLCLLTTGTSERIETEPFGDGLRGSFADPALSPDGRLLLTEIGLEGEHEENLLLVRAVRSPGTELPVIGSQPVEFSGLFFTPDGAAIIAVWNGPDEEDRGVGRFELAQLTAPPKRFHEQLNPFSGARERVPVWNLKWKTLIARPSWARAVAAALSANGRFLAVVDETGDFHVADLKTKRVIVTLPPEAKTRRDRVATRIAFDPAAKRIVRLANGRLFACPISAGQGWDTKPALGTVHDFAFHPDGRTLCAVFSDGQARYLDPHTGEVRQSFKWAKKPQPLYSVAFAPDGLTCAAGGENGKVILWDVDA